MTTATPLSPLKETYNPERYADAIAKPLALLGGTKVRDEKFPRYKVIDEAEQTAVRRVIESGILSRFLGTWHPDFYGGPEVQAFEGEWADFFKVKHAIAVNSATSGLYAAMGACGVGPGDEVIVSPFTMTASAIAPLVYNAVPVFADIEPTTFCLDVASVEARITPYTKAIVVVDIFGQPYDADAINALARKHNLLVIEDCAQAPGALYKGQMAGTLGDMGIYSLNYHKHIHTGEGAVVVTNDDTLAEKLRLIRNHAEAVIEAHPQADTAVQWANMLGFNYRMTEVEAAMGREQLKKLPELLSQRQANVAYLTQGFAQLPCLTPAPTRDGATHAYYLHGLLYDAEAAGGLHRNRFVEAVKAELALIELRETEGVKVSAGYVKPLYWQPLYQNRRAYGGPYTSPAEGGKGSYPWACETYKGSVDYSHGLCPTTERLYTDELITHELMRPGLSQADLDDLLTAFHKVWHHRDALNTAL